MGSIPMRYRLTSPLKRLLRGGLIGPRCQTVANFPLWKEAARRGIRIVYADRFAGTTTDFASRIASARASNPDVYFVEAIGPALDILGQQFRDAQIRNRNGKPELFSQGEKP